jgi:hypothetical protein
MFTFVQVDTIWPNGWLLFSADGLICGLFYRPPSFNSLPQRVGVDTDSFAQFYERNSLSSEGDESVTSPVSLLLFYSCPSAVYWTVPLGVFDAIQLRAWWSDAHVFQETYEA